MRLGFFTSPPKSGVSEYTVPPYSSFLISFLNASSIVCSNLILSSRDIAPGRLKERCYGPDARA